MKNKHYTITYSNMGAFIVPVGIDGPHTAKLAKISAQKDGYVLDGLRIIEHDEKFKSDEIVDRVIEKLATRSEVGIKKYGTTLNDNDHDDFFKHLQEELLDAANYCEVLIKQLKSVNELINLYPNDADLGYAIRKKYGQTK